MNQVLLTGRIATAPKLIDSPSSSHRLCTFRLAVKRTFKTKATEEVKSEFFSITTWGGVADACHKYLDVGREVTIGGRLRAHSYTNADGKHWVTEIVAERVEFMGRKTSSPGNGNQKNLVSGNNTTAIDDNPVETIVDDDSDRSVIAIDEMDSAAI